MSEPTPSEREHYQRLVGRRIVNILLADMEGQAMPVLVLDGTAQNGQAAVVSVLSDPEGNGPGHLDHRL